MAAKKKKKKKAVQEAEKSPPLEELTAVFLEFGLEISRRLPSQSIVMNADVFPTTAALSAFLDKKGKVKVVFVTRKEDTYAQCKEKGAAVLSVPDVPLTRMGQIKMAVLVGFARNLFHLGDRLLCLSGVSESAVIDTMFYLEVGREFEFFATDGGELLPALNPDVFERLMTVASSLAQEGREGRPVGTTFVLGEAEELTPFTEQMIFNPFRGYPREDRNILDPTMEETIREFAAIDGAFLVSPDGVVETAGTFLRSPMVADKLPRGLGARHQSAAAITAATSAVAITISESTGTVTVFRAGRIMIEVERPRSTGSLRARRVGDGLHSAQPGGGDGSP
ncbi:MAG: DNA integrity scanning protein DisA nucleotide-binding domain protein [Planctomycetota bacterium]|jgi:DNA integrity scanning protein DisA with diadenylate cyclase activity